MTKIKNIISRKNEFDIYFENSDVIIRITRKDYPILLQAITDSNFLFETENNNCIHISKDAHKFQEQINRIRKILEE